MDDYLKYFGCLLFGVGVADLIAPKLKHASLFEHFLLGGVVTYGGALWGSYFYKLYTQQERCTCGACCHDSDSDEE